MSNGKLALLKALGKTGRKTAGLKEFGQQQAPGMPWFGSTQNRGMNSKSLSGRKFERILGLIGPKQPGRSNGGPRAHLGHLKINWIGPRQMSQPEESLFSLDFDAMQ